MRPAKVIQTTLRILGWSIVAVVVVILAVFGTLFLYFSNLPWAWARLVLAVAFVAATIGLFVFLKPRWKATAAFFALYALLVVWYVLIPASNDRAWQPDVAQTPSAEIDGDTLTVHNVRDFRYRSVEDYDVNWETRTYDLSTLQSLDYFFSYWGSTTIAHTMLSFGFADGRYLCISVETRKEIGETYAPIRSFFKQFELVYILGDERDLVALRTNHRREDVYLFPTREDPARIRALLLDILERANSLARRPEYYRTIRDNCTTSLLGHIDRVADEPTPFSLALILNGYMPEQAYQRGRFESDAPFAEVKQQYAISARAQALPSLDDFSRQIRAGLGAPIRERQPVRPPAGERSP